MALLPAFLLMGAFEWTREAARRPFVLNQVMYSNGVTVAQAEALQGESFLARTKWAAVHKASDENLIQAGAELFKFQCYACHTVGGFNNDILQKTAAMDFPALHGYLLNVIHKRPYMPPFLGNEQEAMALAAYIAGDLQGKDVDPALLETPVGQGQKLYEENCVGCHGLDIIQEWATGQTLAEIVAGLDSLSALNEMMENFSGTPEEKELLAAFFQSPGSQPQSAADMGRSIFEQNCTGCHGSDVIMTWSKGKSEKAIAEGLTALGKLNPMMQGLSLDDEDRLAMANWALSGSKGEEQ
jgi:mono/diheme cytochrome c family protein